MNEIDCDGTTADRVLFRVRVSNGRLERIVDLAGFPHLDTWLGLPPDDSPLMLRDVRQTEIDALHYLNWLTYVFCSGRGQVLSSFTDFLERDYSLAP
jgi:hypothetical protein